VTAAAPQSEGKIIVDAKMPRWAADMISAQLAPWVHLLPTWCETLLVFYDDEPGNSAVITTHVHEEYRWAKMVFYPGYFSSRPEYQVEAVKHDLLHIATAIVADFARDAIKRLAKDNPLLSEVLLDMLGQRVEAMTQDLTGIVRRVEACAQR
jgi:hypothetical protein